MALIRGVQLADAPNGITTSKINNNAVTDAKVDGSVLSTNSGNVAPVNDYTALGKKITNVADGTVASDAVNFGQLQAVQQGMAWKAACETGTIDVNGNPEPVPNAPIFAGAPGSGGTLTSSVNTTLIVGNVTVNKLGMRVIVTSFSAPPDLQKNGIYELTQIGSGAVPWILTRANDMDVTAEVPRAATTIDNPNSYAFGKVYVVSSPLFPPGAFVLNDGPITWASMPLPAALVAGNGISISGLTISVDIDATPQPPPAGRGLTFNGTKLAADIEPNLGMKFDDSSGRFRTYLDATPNVEGGIAYGSTGGLVALLEAATVASGGLEIGPNSGIQPKLDANSAGLMYTTLGLRVKTKTAVAIDSTGALAINGSGQLIAQVNSTSGGFQINAANEIEAKLEPSTPTSGGFQISGSGGMEAKLNPSGGIDYSATGLTNKVGTPSNDNPGLTLSTAGIYNNVVTRKQWSPAVASAGSGTAITADTMDFTPFRANGQSPGVGVSINGVEYEVLDSTNPLLISNAEIYFSSDGGTTPKSWATIAAGDAVYRGGALAFDTIVGDKVLISYQSPS
jgi:hypothetical protein